MASKLKQPQPLLSDLVSGMSSVPSNYIRPANDRPIFHEVVSFDGAIPLIDLQGLNGPKRSDIIKEIGLACLNYGFFQVLSLSLSLSLTYVYCYWTWISVFSFNEYTSHHFFSFQRRSKVSNHGISEAVIDNMLDISREFFHMPESERLKNYSDDPMKTMRLSTSFNVRTENVSSWRDYLRLHCHPLEDYIQEWPTNPPSFRYYQKKNQLLL